jgi:hypothetical protein
MPSIAPIKTGVSPVMVTCPHCPSQVREDRLARHIRRYHGLPTQTNGRKTSSRTERAEPSSAFLRTPCSCGGTNENCFKCGGWGYIDSIGVGRSTPVAKGFGRENTYEARFEGRLRNPVATGSPMHRCPICGITVKRLARHLAKAHPAQWDDRFVSPPEGLNAKKLPDKSRTSGNSPRSSRKAVPDPKPRAQHGLKSANAVTPKPMRPIAPAPPSKPDTGGHGGTTKPPPIDPTIRAVREFLKGHPLSIQTKPQRAKR